MALLSDVQRKILAELEEAAKALSQRELVYCSEWLGYMPFGAYHWVEVCGEDVSTRFPAGWQQVDLQQLERAGCLRQLGRWQDPDDEHHYKLTYALV